MQEKQQGTHNDVNSTEKNKTVVCCRSRPAAEPSFPSELWTRAINTRVRTKLALWNLSDVLQHKNVEMSINETCKSHHLSAWLR